MAWLKPSVLAWSSRCVRGRIVGGMLLNTAMGQAQYVDRWCVWTTIAVLGQLTCSRSAAAEFSKLV
jgi:hypothetical protein